jgi:uncharacterized membrane protein
MKTKFLIALLFPFVPLFYLGFQWNHIPEIVPLHFNLDMNPDRFGAKSELLLGVIIIGCISISLTLLIKYFPKIDAKKNLENQKGLLESIGLGTSIFMAIISYFVVQSGISGGGKGSIITYIPMLILFFMAFLGNYMINIKRNHFIGIRTSWTLESESVWRKTHQFAGKLMFYSSLTGIIMLFFISDLKLKMIFMGVLLLIILSISTFKSYKFYKEESIV